MHPETGDHQPSALDIVTPFRIDQRDRFVLWFLANQVHQSLRFFAGEPTGMLQRGSHGREDTTRRGPLDRPAIRPNIQ